MGNLHPSIHYNQKYQKYHYILMFHYTRLLQNNLRLLNIH